MLQGISVLLIVAAITNVYFVWHGWLIYRRDPHRSPLLRALFVVKLVVWVVAAWSAWAAARFLTGTHDVLPFGGIGLGLILLAVNALPAYVHLQMRRIERSGE